MLLANTYNQNIEDIKEWLTLTEWSQEKIDIKQLEQIKSQLIALEIIEN